MVIVYVYIYIYILSEFVIIHLLTNTGVYCTTLYCFIDVLEHQSRELDRGQHPGRRSHTGQQRGENGVELCYGDYVLYI